MASSNDILTKYKSAVTVVTAKAANAWYGGLYGSTEASGLSATDPLVAGHVHDGRHIDGHAQKIDLVSHVTGQIRNVNIGTDEVDKRTISSYPVQSDGIPEYEIVDGTPYYYLDLSIIRSEIQTPPFTYDSGIDAIVYNSAAGPDALTTDFIVSSPTLDYDGTHSSRLFFDRANSAFRVGVSNGTQWNSANRAQGSFAWGYNTTAASEYSFVGGSGNTISNSSNRSFIGAGGEGMGSIGPDLMFSLSTVGNTIDNSSYAGVIVGGGANSIGASVASTYSGILGGLYNTINNGHVNIVVGGQSNAIGTATTVSTHSFIGSGLQNSIEIAAYGFIGGGSDNVIAENNGFSNDYSGIVSGLTNVINQSTAGFIGSGRGNILGGVLISDESNNAAIIAGQSNSITASEDAFIGAGSANIINGASTGSFIGSGTSNYMFSIVNGFIGAGSMNAVSGTSTCTFIGSGQLNSIQEASDYSSIVGGTSNQIVYASVASTIAGGESNRIGNSASFFPATYSVISGGLSNVVQESYSAVVGGQQNSIMENAEHGFIGSGINNVIGDNVNSTDHSGIVSGESNLIYSEFSFVGSGAYNIISDLADYSSLIGGQANGVGDGSTLTRWSVIGGGTDNVTTGDFSIIVGGNYNSAFGQYNIVVGGQNQDAEVGTYHIIGGGQLNTVKQNSNAIVSPNYAGIFSGYGNSIYTGDYLSTVLVSSGGSGYAVYDILQLFGGTGNPATVIVTGVSLGAITSVVIGHTGNYLVNPSSPNSPTNINGGGGTGAELFVDFSRSDNSEYNGILSGSSNEIASSSYASSISGYLNKIYLAKYSSISGGYNNEIDGSGDSDGAEIENAEYSSISGGKDNIIKTELKSSAGFCIIGNGEDNTINSADYSAILDGKNNVISKAIYAYTPPSYGLVLSGNTNYILGETIYTLVGNGIENMIQTGLVGNGSASCVTILNGAYNAINAGLGSTDYNSILNGNTCSIESGSGYSTIINGDNNTISIGTEHSMLFGLNNEIGTDHTFGMGEWGSATDSYSSYIAAGAFDAMHEKGQAQYSVNIGKETVTVAGSPMLIVSHNIGYDNYSLHVQVDWTTYRMDKGTERLSTGTYTAIVYDNNGSGTYTITNIAGATWQQSVGLAGTVTPSMIMTGANGSILFRLEFSSATDLESNAVATMKVTKTWKDRIL